MTRGLALGGALALVMAQAAAQAETTTACRAQTQQRDALAREAMRAEISLAARYREQHCPELNRQAELANANSLEFAPIDYQALLHCRQAAEQQLERDNPVLYRNQLGFTFYSADGSAAARLADRALEALKRQGCSP
jgi:hypothetical protein